MKNRTLAKSIADAGWGELVRQLDYKSDWAGRRLIKIDQWYPSSKTCSGCGHVLQKLALSTRSWTCPVCGEKHDRDTNAAKNIKAVGLTVLACGERVRPMVQVA
jgi:putative transposase